ncbi:MAG TPA: TIGR03560 family F420-dependent LLM class oxidoreductase [Anaerolineales bacterium]|nr:TIGR03560 family F420-dependent LLM class oxidoreductase [Anaerolineales bacterium]
MKFGLRNTSFVYPNGTGDIWEDTKAHVQRAERDGFASFWVMDHFYQLPVHGSEGEPFFDAWTILPALAAVTNRIRLGAMVSPVGYRNPALLARMAASLDHISGGRMNFGFGAGGYKPEYQAYGYEFEEKGSVRLAQMKEALELILELWHEPRTTFHGQFFHVENAILEPKPLQKPHPPILIGGVGPKITLKIIAEMGDACNLWGPPTYFAEQRDTLKRHCDTVGRDESTIEKTTYDLVLCAPTEAALKTKIERLLPKGVESWMTFVGTPSKLVDLVGEYARVGADHLCLDFAGNDPESYRLFVKEVMGKTSIFSPTGASHQRTNFQ